MRRSSLACADSRQPVGTTCILWAQPLPDLIPLSSARAGEPHVFLPQMRFPSSPATSLCSCTPSAMSAATQALRCNTTHELCCREAPVLEAARDNSGRCCDAPTRRWYKPDGAVTLQGQRCCREAVIGAADATMQHSGRRGSGVAMQHASTAAGAAMHPLYRRCMHPLAGAAKPDGSVTPQGQGAAV